ASRQVNCGSGKSGAKVGASGCSLNVRWLRQDMVEARHVLLITGTGHLSSHEAASLTLAPADDHIADSRLRNFTCQSLMFNDQTERFEPTANAAPCFGK
ncbi:MAG: hypothetical protein ABI142_09625, partial [Bryocella sp.]